MITGDKKETAVAVGHEVGLLGQHTTVTLSPAALGLEEEELVLTSDQLRLIDDAHLQLLLPKYTSS